MHIPRPSSDLLEHKNPLYTFFHRILSAWKSVLHKDRAQ